MHIYIYIYTHTHIRIYIYVYIRESDKCMCIYIYIYITHVTHNAGLLQRDGHALRPLDLDDDNDTNNDDTNRV